MICFSAPPDKPASPGQSLHHGLAALILPLLQNVALGLHIQFLPGNAICAPLGLYTLVYGGRRM